MDCFAWKCEMLVKLSKVKYWSKHTQKELAHAFPGFCSNLREVDREWALVMNHQISLPLTI